MITRIIEWSIENRFLVLLFAALLTVGGIMSLRQTPLDAIPDLSDVQVIVKTSYPGQAPQVVEDQVTYPLTTAMLAVPKAVNVRGYSFFGDSYVYIIFEDGTDLYWARSRVLEYLSQVSGKLPAGASPELGPDATGVGWVYQYALVDRTGTRDLADLTSIQNWFLKFELQSVPGVAEVATIGGMVRQYQIVVDPDKLRIFNLTLRDVRRAIQAGNQEVGGSVIEMAEAEYMIRARGYVSSLDDLEKIPVGRQSEGTPLLLRDVGSVSLGPQMRRGVAELNGEGETVGGVVVMRWGENAYATIQSVKDKLNELSAGLPEGVEIVVTYDRSSLIERAVGTLQEKLLEEFIIIALVCAVFLMHLRSALVIVVTLPLGVLAAFIVMNGQGITANIMSLGGIAIALGAMVDAAVVMIEAYHKQLEGREISSAEQRWELVKQTAVKVGPALFFALLIITVSFIPVFSLEAQEGRLFKPLAFTKTYAMAAAAILSVTLVPVLMGFFIRGKICSEHENPLNRFLTAAYKPLLDNVLRFPKAAVLIVVLIGATAIPSAMRMGSEFMPDLDEGDLFYMPNTFPGVSIGKARELVQQTNRMIRTVPEVETVFGKAGRAQTATDPAPLTMIETIIRLKPRDEWRDGMTMQGIKEELNAAVKVPGIRNTFLMPIKTRIDMLSTGIKTPVGIKIAGTDLAVISRVGEEIERVLTDVPGTASVFSERVTGGRYIDVDVRREAAARYGMNVADVQEVVRSAIGGGNISESVEGLERYPINLRFPKDYRSSVPELRHLPVVTPTGAHVTLGDLAALEIVSGPPMIRSENARQNGWIYVDIDDRDLGSYVAEAQAVVAANVDMPTGYTLSWSGQFEYKERAEARLAVIIPITLAVIVVILFVAFRRFAEVALIIGSLPLALAGGIALVSWLGFDMSVAIGVGFIALAGVSVEIAIVMLIYLDLAFENRVRMVAAEGRTLADKDIKAVVVQGALERLRPIAMTVAIIIGGLLPIMMGTGTGSEVMQRIAAPMVGGMASALILTLVVVPALYLIWRRAGLSKG